MRAVVEKILPGLSLVGIRFLSILVGLFYVKYYTNKLSIEQVGIFFYLGTLSYLLNAFVFVPVDCYAQAKLSERSILPTKALLKLIVAALLVAFLICLAMSVPLVALGKLSVFDVPLLYFMAVLLAMCSSFRNLFNNRGYALLSAGMVLVESLGRLIIFILVVWLLGATAQTLLLSSVLALSIELAILFWQALRRLPFVSNGQAIGTCMQIARVSAVLAGGAVSNAVQLQSYKVVYQSVGYSSTAAVFGVVSNIGAVAMSACSQVFSQVFLPRLYQDKGAFIGKYVLMGCGVASFLLVGAMLFSRFIVAQLTSLEYVPYAYAIGAGVLLEAGNMLIGAYSVYLTLNGRAPALLWLQGIGALVSMLGIMVAIILAPGSAFYLGCILVVSQFTVVITLSVYVYRLERGTINV